MKKTAIATLVAASMAATPAFAGVAEELAAMKQRIAQLESQLAEQQATIAKQEQSSGSSSMGGFAENVTVSGELELLANHVEQDGGNSTSDIVVDTFKLNIEADINEMVSVASVLKYDDADQDIQLDEAYAVIGNDDTFATLTAGKTAIPVAAINDAGWTSPLTDDFFDITEGMAMVSFGGDMVAADVYTHNNGEGDSINTVGLNVALTPAEGVTLGAGYINDLNDTTNDLNTLVASSEDAWRLNAMLETGALAFTAEYLEVDGTTTDPSFLALNASYNTSLMGEDATLYLGWSEVDDSNADAERTVVGIERAFGDNAAVVAEIVRDEDNTGADTDTLNLVLVTEF